MCAHRIESTVEIASTHFLLLFAYLPLHCLNMALNRTRLSAHKRVLACVSMCVVKQKKKSYGHRSEPQAKTHINARKFCSLMHNTMLCCDFVAAAATTTVGSVCAMSFVLLHSLMIIQYREKKQMKQQKCACRRQRFNGVRCVFFFESIDLVVIIMVSKNVQYTQIQ